MVVPPTNRDWSFHAPHGVQPVVELPFSEIITIARHLEVRGVRSYLNAAALNDVRDAGTPPPQAIDAQGRSAQRFAMDVVAVGASGTRRASAHGQDIYAVSAPLVAEAAARIREPSFQRRGALALGQAFDARDFLHALTPTHLTVELDPA
jgi:2,4-dienoyl-CoA reductase-like NADH-dependent reductase (Old Yellow Enzyme family)